MLTCTLKLITLLMIVQENCCSDNVLIKMDGVNEQQRRKAITMKNITMAKLYPWEVKNTAMGSRKYSHGKSKIYQWKVKNIAMESQK